VASQLVASGGVLSSLELVGFGYVCFYRIFVPCNALFSIYCLDFTWQRYAVMSYVISRVKVQLAFFSQSLFCLHHQGD
jgi:hypothetical protein